MPDRTNKRQGPEVPCLPDQPIHTRLTTEVILNNKKIGGYLIEHNICDENTLIEALDLQSSLSKEGVYQPIGKIILERNTLDPEVLESCLVEPSLKGVAPGARFQFERQGYFCVDPDSTDDKPAFNRTLSLRDTWAKIQKQQSQKK